MKTETVNTHALKVGDRVLAHGAVFELTERHHSLSHSPLVGNVGPSGCVWFRTKFVGASDNGHAIPAHWLHDWRIQGNYLATWRRVTD
jgi:hypothetical protein